VREFSGARDEMARLTSWGSAAGAGREARTTLEQDSAHEVNTSRRSSTGRDARARVTQVLSERLGRRTFRCRDGSTACGRQASPTEPVRWWEAPPACWPTDHVPDQRPGQSARRVRGHRRVPGNGTGSGNWTRVVRASPGSSWCPVADTSRVAGEQRSPRKTESLQHSQDLAVPEGGARRAETGLRRPLTMS